MGSQQFCLKWNNHQSNMLTVFEQLLSNEAFVDVTLACEGLSLKAHKMVLSACSPFFQALFVENPCKHPIVILKDTRYMDLKAIVEFMYRGEVNVSQDQLSALLKTAETLKVKGLAEVTGERSHNLVPVNGEGTRPSSPPLAKRKRGRPRRRSASDSNRSDSEDQSARVKGAPDSPEIIEDGSLSCDRLSLPTPAKVAARTSTTTTAAVVPVTTSAKDSSVSTLHEDTMPVDDAAGSPADDVDFEVDASNLMEQSMTTENARVFPDVQSSTLVLAEASTHHTASSQESTQLATSLPSDISISSQDIKPAPSSLIPYNDPSASSSAVVPTQPPSAVEAASGGSLLFMDSSGVPAIPGPSNYNADKQPSTPSHGPASAAVLQDETHEGLLLPLLLKKEEADDGQIDCSQDAEALPSLEGLKEEGTDQGPMNSSQDTEGDAPEIATPRLRRGPRLNRVRSLTFEEGTTTDVCKCQHTVNESHGDSHCASVLVSEKPLEGQKHDDRSAQSHVCEESFSQKCSLDSHISIHTGKRPFKCNICEKSFSGKNNLYKHTLIHSSFKRFKCNDCEKSFSQKRSLDNHIRTHTGERPFKCNVCEVSFSLKCNLDKHLRVHTGERPFTCNVCKMPFSQKFTLDVHTRIHTGERPFKCNVCEKSFSYKSSLKNHIRIHTGQRPFKCGACEKSFSVRSNLDNHIRIHRGERPFKCNVCERSFLKKDHLDNHIRIHTGERPFKCTVCEKSFLQKATLHNHIRIHTGENTA